jgi:hypothetical protein
VTARISDYTNGVVLIVFGFLVSSCSDRLSDPQEIIDQCIRVHGGDKYLQAEIGFDFRDRHYITRRNGGVFSKERIRKDSTGVIHDILTNGGFIREINGKTAAIPDSMAVKYTASINSVIYFALLPYALNDPSVNKTFLGTTQMDGQPYYKVQVTFGPDAGEGHQDIFYYWIHQKNFTLDYLAYHYLEDGKWDTRLRKALNRNTVGGILFQDYINYKPDKPDQPFEQVEEMFKSQTLVELSRIELKNITVK